MLRYFVALVWISCFVLSLDAQLPLYDLPNPTNYEVASSASMAVTRGGRFVFANLLAGTVSIYNPFDNRLDAELNVGLEPFAVAVTPDGNRALAISQVARRLVVIDLNTNTIEATYGLAGTPFGIVADNNRAYLSLWDANKVLVVNIATGRIIEQISTPASPAGVALWGDFLYVTHFWTGELSLIYLPAAEVVRTVRYDSQATLSPSIEIDPINGLAFLPQSLRTNQDFQAVVQVVNLNTMLLNRTIRLHSPNYDLSMPYGVKQPSNRSRLYLTFAGSDLGAVLDLSENRIINTFETGANPRALLFNRAYTQVYVHELVDNTFSSFDTNFFAVSDVIPTQTGNLGASLQIGARLFHSANELSRQGTVSCASCHFADSRLTLGDFGTDWLNEHLAVQQGGLALEGLDLQALVDYLKP